MGRLYYAGLRLLLVFLLCLLPLGTVSNIVVAEDFGAILSNGGEISGKVTGADGKPLPGVIVRVKDTEGNLVNVTTTGKDGMYNFSDLTLGEKYAVTASHGIDMDSQDVVLLESAKTANLQLLGKMAIPAATAPVGGAGGSSQWWKYVLIGVGSAGAGAGIALLLMDCDDDSSHSKKRPTSP